MTDFEHFAGPQGRTSVPPRTRLSLVGTRHRETRRHAPHPPQRCGLGRFLPPTFLGLDYWFTPSAVGKIAYEFNKGMAGTPNDVDRFMLQFGYGF